MAINKSWLNNANLPAPTQANFPALVHRFLPQDVSADLMSITDPIGGVKIVTGLPFTVSGNTFQPGAGATGWAQTGAWSAPGNKSILLLSTGGLTWVGQQMFLVGDSVDVIYPFIAVKNSGFGGVSFSAADYSTASAVSPAQTAPILAGATLVNNAGNACTSFALGTGNTSVGTDVNVVTGSLTQNWPSPSPISSGTAAVFSLSPLSGCYVLYFNEAPSVVEVQGILAWMAANPGYLPPSLLGRT